MAEVHQNQGAFQILSRNDDFCVVYKPEGICIDGGNQTSFLQTFFFFHVPFEIMEGIFWPQSLKKLPLWRAQEC